MMKSTNYLSFTSDKIQAIDSELHVVTPEKQVLSVVHVYCSSVSKTRFHSFDIDVGVIEIIQAETFNTVLVNEIDARVLRAANKT